MQQATVFVMVGYPGAGKTTASRLICDLTGAVHIWADHERKKVFGRPTHHQTESLELYRRLNAETEKLLQEGKSVVFDTSFNHRKDRDYMRQLAGATGAHVVIVWVRTPKELAKARALHMDHARDNKYPHTMSGDQFDRLAGNLETPQPDENPVELDGTRLTPEYVRHQLGLAG